MKRRWKLCIGLTALLLTSALSLHPTIYWSVIGHLKGEAFYKGKPTSYWRGMGDGVRWQMLSDADPGEPDLEFYDCRQSCQLYLHRPVFRQDADSG